jgi:hypothetical protein
MSEVLVNGAIEGAKALPGIIDTIITRINISRNQKFDKNNLLRAYYMEVSANLGFLNAIRMDQVSSYTYDSPELHYILANLQITIAASILFSETDAEKAAFKDFQSSPPMNVTEDPEEKTVKYSNILQAISFTVEKIGTLQIVLDSDPTVHKIYKKLMIRKRVSNIKERLEIIRNYLKKLPEVQDIAR